MDHLNAPTLSKDTTLTGLQTYVKEISVIRGQDKNDIQTNFLILNEKVGQLARALRIYNEVKMATNAALVDVQSEVADVCLALTSLSNELKINMATAVRIKEDANKRRLWF